MQTNSNKFQFTTDELVLTISLIYRSMMRNKEWSALQNHKLNIQKSVRALRFRCVMEMAISDTLLK